MEAVYVLLGVVGGGVTAGVPLYLRLRQGVSAIRKEERADAEGEWSRAADRMGREIDRLTAQNARQETQITSLQEEHNECIQDKAQTKAEIQILKHQVEQLQRLSTAATVSMMATVTADDSGTIVDADEAVRDILGWRAIDLVGQNVDMIIPKRIRARHHAGLERTRESGSGRPPDIALQTYALTRDRREIPVIVSLNPWRDETGKKMISAQIVHRRVFESMDALDGGTDVHAALGALPPPSPDPDSQSAESMPKPGDSSYGKWKSV